MTTKSEVHPGATIPSGASYEVAYTEAMVKQAVRLFVWRRIFVEQKRLWIGELLALAGFAALLISGHRSWYVGLIGGVALIAPIVSLVIWRAHYVNTIGKFRQMHSPTAVIGFTDTSLDITSDLGSGQITWSSITEIWEAPGFWMIFNSPGSFNTLPDKPLSASDRAFLRAKATDLRSKKA